MVAVTDVAITERELEAARTARAVRTARADARATDTAPLIGELQAAGATSLHALAAEWNRPGVRTSRGVGEWQAGSVARLLARL
jgi:hypothetical protein